MWVPDSYILGQVTYTPVQALFKGMTFIAYNKPISKNSTQMVLMFQTRVYVQTKCSMNFDEFPFDKQECNVLVSSMQRQRSIVWNTKGINWFKTDMRHPEYDIDIKEYEEKEITKENRTLAVSGFIFYMNRKSRSYIVTYFLPCFLMVILSWVSFLIKPEVVPGRIGLLLTVLLMMINLNNTVSRSSPISGSINPLLIWIQGSIAFVFLALIEYATILFKIKYAVQLKPSAPNTWKAAKISDPKQRDKSSTQTGIDAAALVVFPASYLLFIIVFIYCL